ncbi:hypothetical protein Tco_1085050 [Tanacetum coccineum]
MELDLEARLMGETLVINRSLDPFLEDYIELNDLNEPFELRRNQGDDLMPTIEEGEVIKEFRTRDEDLDTGIDDYPSYYDEDKKIHIDCAHNLKFSCMIGFEFTHANFFSLFKHFKTLSLDESRSPDFDIFSDQEEYLEEKVTKAITETMEQYMSKTRANYGSGVVRPKIEDKDNFKLKGQFLKELRDNTFSGLDHKDANEHIKKVLEIVDLFHIPNITIDQVMLRAFHMSLTGAVSRWLRNKPSGSITTWEDLKTKFLSKYCPPARTAKKMEEINNFQQEPNENLYQAWERFKELLMKCPQHYLTEMQETAIDAKVSIQEMAEYSQKWHNRTSRTRRGGYRATVPGFYQRNNANPSYQEQRKSMEETLSNLMSKSAKRHEENSNLIKEIQASTDAAIRNQ